LSKTSQFLLISLCLIATSCASTNRAKSIYLTGGAFALGGAAGAITSPRGESALMHGTLWGGLAAGISSIASLFIFDSEKENKELKETNNKLVEEIGSFNKLSAPEIEAANEIGFGKPLPQGLREIVKPGKWRLYKLDQWIDAGDNSMIHQDRMIEIMPAVLKIGK